MTRCYWFYCNVWCWMTTKRVSQCHRCALLMYAQYQILCNEKWMTFCVLGELRRYYERYLIQCYNTSRLVFFFRSWGSGNPESELCVWMLHVITTCPFIYFLVSCALSAEKGGRHIVTAETRCCYIVTLQAPVKLERSFHRKKKHALSFRPRRRRQVSPAPRCVISCTVSWHIG